MCGHFKFLMHTINVDIELNETEKNPQNFKKNYDKILNQVHQLVELHVKIYDIFKIVADIHNGLFFMCLGMQAITIGLISYDFERVSLLNFITIYKYTNARQYAFFV